MIPPRQNNLADAADSAFEQFTKIDSDRLICLGASRAEQCWTLPVLDDAFTIDPISRTVRTSSGEDVAPKWAVLTLHYLAMRGEVPDDEPSVTFAELPGGRTYAPIYRQRVNERLCYTAGRDAKTMAHAAEEIGGLPIVEQTSSQPSATDEKKLAWKFQIFPKLGVKLIYHLADDEFPSSATLLLPKNIEEMLPPEDIVVLSENLVAKLQKA